MPSSRRSPPPSARRSSGAPLATRATSTASAGTITWPMRATSGTRRTTPFASVLIRPRPPAAGARGRPPAQAPRAVRCRLRAVPSRTSELDLQAVVRGGDAKRRFAARQLFQPPRIAQRRVDGGIAVGGLVVKEHKVLHFR